jgi:hypothetical protein
LAEGYVRFERSEPHPITGRFVVSISIGVVHPDKVTSLESRIRENQDVVASEVVAEARKEIFNWASEFSGPEGVIRKGLAANFVSDAFRTVTQRRKNREAEKQERRVAV